MADIFQHFTFLEEHSSTNQSRSKLKLTHNPWIFHWSIYNEIHHRSDEGLLVATVGEMAVFEEAASRFFGGKHKEFFVLTVKKNTIWRFSYCTGVYVNSSNYFVNSDNGENIKSDDYAQCCSCLRSPSDNEVIWL